MQIYDEAEQLCLFGPDFSHGKTSPAPSPAPRGRTSVPSWRKLSELKAIPYMSLDLTPGAGNLLGESYWEILSPWRGGLWTLNTGVSPREEKESSLSQILQEQVPRRYYLSKTACLGILRRARERGKELPPQLKTALEIQSGLRAANDPHTMPPEGEAFHINQRNEGIDLGGVSGALMATQNMQMQTFVTQPDGDAVKGFNGYSGDLTGDVAATLGVNCDMSTGRNGVIHGAPTAFAANQRDEVRDLHDIAGTLSAQPGMKQQTFIAEGCLTPWDTQQARVFTPDSTAPTLTGADGGGGRNPAGLLFAAGFCAGASPTAGNIGYQEETAPTLKAGESGTNMVPSILCLNDQGGRQMSCTEDMVGTLRAQEHGHQPLVFENHGIDSRYTGPHEIAPTMSARYGTGGNNVPLVTAFSLDSKGSNSMKSANPHSGCRETEVARTIDTWNPDPAKNQGGIAILQPKPICIAGNIIDRQPQNGGNGLGCQEDVAYTLTATDHHAVFSRQRVDVFKDGDIASTQSARQHKDATDLICQPTCQETAETIDHTDHKDTSNQFVRQTKCRVEGAYLIRRLTPLECERLQGFPDLWTDIPSASDSARYKALGNSVAIPCVEYIMHGLALVLSATA